MGERRNGDDGDRFRVRPSAPKARQPSFVSKVLREAGKAGPSVSRKTDRTASRTTGGSAGQRPGARLGRGHVAARFAGQSLAPNARRAAVKARVVNLGKAGARSTVTHLRYIEREGVGREGEPGQAYSALSNEADLSAFEERGREDRHQFRFIVSPEDAAQLEDLRTYTRHLMGRMEADLGTRLDWVAVDHWNTDNPHTHIVLRGKDQTDKDLVIAGDYIAHGMRDRAAELATEWLGPRTELEIQQALVREVQQERWTSLDRTLQREARDGLNDLNRAHSNAKHPQQRMLLVGRLQRLHRMGLATEAQRGVWAVHAEVEATLRAMGERGDIVRTMQRAMGGRQLELSVFEPANEAPPVIGRIAAKGLADELYDKGYLVVDGIDGKAHYVALPAKSELAQYPVGAVVEVRGASGGRAADRAIAALAADGIYRTDHHLLVARAQANPERDPGEVVDAHVRRLEALRREGIVERLAEGVWQVPQDLPEQGRRYDSLRQGGVAVELRSHLPIERQARAIGVTWLDQQLIGGGNGVGTLGFGSEVRQALQQRSDFLMDQGLAERRGQRVILARNLLATLRDRELATAGRAIAAQTGLTHRPIVDGERVGGVYRQSLQLASGRFAMLDDGMGFSLVPWKPVIEQRLGQQLSAVMRGSSVTWSLGRQRGPSVG